MLLLVLLFIGSISYTTSYSISDQRTTFKQQSCSQRQRTSFIMNIKQYQQNQYVSSVTQSTYSVNRDFLFRAVISQDISKIYSELTHSSTTNFINFILLYIGAGILVVFSPFLLACICCPKCYRKQRRKQPYSNCAYCCPNFTVIIVSIIIIAVCIFLIIYGLSFRRYYADFKCSTAILMDDLLNGNYDNDTQNYFSGISTFNKSLPLLLGRSDELEFIGRQLQGLPRSGQLYNVTQQSYNLSQNIIQIPSYTGQFRTLQYQTPLLRSQKNANIKSIVPQILGSYKQPSSLVERLYSNASRKVQGLKTLALSAANFTDSVQQFSNKYTTISAGIFKSTRNAQQNNFKLQQLFTLFQQQGFLLIVQIIFFTVVGLLLLFSFIAIVASFRIVSGKKQRKSKLACVACAVIWIMSILFFAISILLSVLYPTIYYSCQLIQDKIYPEQGEVSFKSYFNTLFEDNEFIEIMGACLSKNKPSNIPIISDNTLVFQQLLEMLQQLEQFSKNNAVIENNLDKSSENSLEIVTKYRYSVQIDITDPNSLSQLRRIQSASSYSMYQCNASGFRQDSWSTKQYFQCNIFSQKSDNSSCRSAIAFQRRQSGCTGCIKTMEILQMIDSYKSVQNSINNRYPGCGRSDDQFNTELNNLWVGYYKKKKQFLEPIRQKLVKIQQQVKALNNKFQQGINPLLERLNSQRLDWIANKRYGLIAGNSCQIIGEDFRNSHRIICYKATQYLFFIRITMIVISFLTILVVVCLSCSSYRLYFNRIQSSATSSRKKINQNKNAQSPQNQFDFNQNYFGNYGETSRNLKF